MKPSTPCINVCRIDPVTQICEGCHRTLAEIGAWGQLSETERKRIMATLPARANTQTKEGTR